MNKIKKGRYGEYSIILKLLERGFEVYPSLVDDRGIDLVIRNPNGSYLEIQVKSVWSEKFPQWFGVQTKSDTGLVRDNFFIICLDQMKTTWIFPSRIFFTSSYTQKSKSKNGIFTFELNLQARPRGNKSKRGEILKEYKENWDILLNP